MFLKYPGHAPKLPSSFTWLNSNERDKYMYKKHQRLVFQIKTFKLISSKTFLNMLICTKKYV